MSKWRWVTGFCRGGGATSTGRPGTRRDHFRDGAECRGLPGRDIEQTGRPVRDDLEHQLNRVIDMQMVARFLAVAEQRDAAVLECLAQEPVRALRIVGVALAVERGQPHDRQRRLGLGRQHQLARAMHGAIEIERNRRRLLGDEAVANE